MAQTLINRRGSTLSPKPIGKRWVYRFLKQHPQPDTRLARNYDAQQAKNEDPKIINKLDEDIIQF